MDMNELVNQIQIVFDNSMEKLKVELRQEMNQKFDCIHQEINKIYFKIEYDIEDKIDTILDYISFQQEKNDKNSIDFKTQDKRIEKFQI